MCSGSRSGSGFCRSDLVYFLFALPCRPTASCSCRRLIGFKRGLQNNLATAVQLARWLKVWVSSENVWPGISCSSLRTRTKKAAQPNHDPPCRCVHSRVPYFLFLSRDPAEARSPSFLGGSSFPVYTRPRGHPGNMIRLMIPIQWHRPPRPVVLFWGGDASMIGHKS